MQVFDWALRISLRRQGTVVFASSCAACPILMEFHLWKIAFWVPLAIMIHNYLYITMK